MSTVKLVLTRRDFLRGISFGAAGLALGANVSAQIKSADRKLGIALLGLGRYSTNQLAPALRETKHCYLAGVVTGSPDKAEKWAATYDLKRKNIYNYDNFDRIADNREIDIVYVVTPPALHPEFVIRAAKAGKHVISEKPMATSVADCDAMIAACEKAKVRLSIGYRLFFDPYHAELRRLARDKDFGPLTQMTGSNSFVMRSRAWRVNKRMAGAGAFM